MADNPLERTMDANNDESRDTSNCPEVMEELVALHECVESNHEATRRALRYRFSGSEVCLFVVLAFGSGMLASPQPYLALGRQTMKLAVEVLGRVLPRHRGPMPHLIEPRVPRPFQIDGRSTSDLR
jgi:hypothetical protein